MHFWKKLVDEEIHWEIMKFPLNYSKKYFQFLTVHIVLKYILCYIFSM